MKKFKYDEGITVEWDDQLRDVVIDVLACLIPSDDNIDFFHYEAAYRYFTELFKILKLEETQGDIWLIYYALIRMSEIRAFDKDFQFVLDKRSFSKSLESNITDLVFSNKNVFIPYLNQNGIDSHLDIQKVLEEASDFIYSSTMETFEEIQEMDVDVNDALKYMDILKDTILAMLSKKSLILGSKIISGEGAYVAGEFYKGSKDYVTFSKMVPSLISSRFSDYLKTRKTSISLTDLATFKAYSTDDTTKIEKLFNIGFEPLDEVFSICTGDLITLVGDEGVGKTNTAVHILMQNIMEGHDVFMMTGESSLTKIVNMCISHYIYVKTGYQFTWKEIMNYTSEDEENQRLIELWQSDFITNPDIGRLHLVQSLNYEDFDSTIEEYLIKYPNISLVVIDHTDRLNSIGTMTDDGFLRDKKMKVDHLYKKQIELKQVHNLTFLNLAHSNTEAQKAGIRGKDMGVRIGATSSATSKDSDFVFYLSKDPNLSDNFVKWSCKKVRDYNDGIKPFVLKKQFEVSTLEYDIEYQLAAIEDDDLTIDDLYG